MIANPRFCYILVEEKDNQCKGLDFLRSNLISLVYHRLRGQKQIGPWRNFLSMKNDNTSSEIQGYINT